MNNPKISVVLPVYNGEKYLAEAIESVVAQDYRPIEVVCIDDGSTDGTRQIIEEFVGNYEFIRYFYQENQGLATSRNVGVQHALGEFIAFIDADDLWEPGRLTDQMAVFERDPQIEMVAGMVRQFVSPDVPDGEREQYRFNPEDIQTNMMGAALIKRAAFDKYGWYNPEFRIGQDMDWVLQAKEQGIQIAELPKLVYHRRLHQHNIGRSYADENYKTRFKILKQMIEQRRDKGDG